MARKTNLDAKVTSPAQMDALITYLRIADPGGVGQVTDQQRGSRATRSTRFLIDTPDHDKAVEVVRTLLKNFEEGTLSGNRSGTDQANVFLTQQIVTWKSACRSQRASWPNSRSATSE